MSAGVSDCDVDIVPLSTRLWAENRDYGESLNRSACSALEDGRECMADTFVRVWRSNASEDVVSLCFRHAREETSIFLVEPVCRHDFHSSEYAFLLEKSALGRRIAQDLNVEDGRAKSLHVSAN